LHPPFVTLEEKESKFRLEMIILALVFVVILIAVCWKFGSSEWDWKNSKVRFFLFSKKAPKFSTRIPTPPRCITVLFNKLVGDDITTACETADGELGDALDVATHHLAVALDQKGKDGATKSRSASDHHRLQKVLRKPATALKFLAGGGIARQFKIFLGLGQVIGSSVFNGEFEVRQICHNMFHALLLLLDLGLRSLSRLGLA
jgi:hypothetical protein